MGPMDDRTSHGKAGGTGERPGDRNGHDASMPLTAHLRELRYRLIVSVVAVLAGMMAVFPYAPVVITWLQRPLQQKLYFFAPTEAFWANLQVAMFGGFLLALPIVSYQLWRFIAPALYRTERRYTLLFLGVSTGSFLAGTVFCHFVAFPFALHFLIDFGLSGGLTPLLSVGIYLGFAVKFYLAFGLIFELPLLLTLLARIGLITASMLARHRRHALLVNAVAAAVLTPTTDVFNMMVMLVPLTLLYELGIWGARLFGRRHATQEMHAEG
jgi:sec-independent protein translocase protein TatC